MRFSLRLAPLLCGPLLLSACNMVMTEKPLFTVADAAGAPTLRPGVWEFYQEPGCNVDVGQPYAKWPDCSGGGVVGASEITGHKSGDPPDQLQHAPLILASGDPRIAQVQITIDLSAGADVSASGGATGSASVSVTKPKSNPYGYAAVRPTKFDAQGRITAFTSWPVQCGPPPPANQKGGQMQLATAHPLTGMEMKRGDADCTTHSIPALRAAAKASRAWADEPRESHWVRDGTQ